MVGEYLLMKKDTGRSQLQIALECYMEDLTQSLIWQSIQEEEADRQVRKMFLIPKKI